MYTEEAESLLLERLIYRILSDDRDDRSKDECKNLLDLCKSTDEVTYDRNTV